MFEPISSFYTLGPHCSNLRYDITFFKNQSSEIKVSLTFPNFISYKLVKACNLGRQCSVQHGFCVL